MSYTATPANRPSRAHALTIVAVDGGGAAFCDDCRGNLSYSWRATLTDGRVTLKLTLCSMCLYKYDHA